MLRVMILTVAVITVPLGAYLFNFRKSPEPLKQVVFVSATELETQVETTPEIDQAVAELVKQAEEAAENGTSLPKQEIKTIEQINLGMVKQIETVMAVAEGDDIVIKLPAAQDTSARALTSNVLANLDMKSAQKSESIKLVALPTSKQASGSSNNFQAMTQSVLENLNITGNDVGTAVNHVETLEELIQHSLKQGRTDGYVDTLMNNGVNQAAYNGKVAVPIELVTASGQVETKALLASLIAQSDLAAGGGYVSMLTAAGSNLNNSKQATLEKDQFYVVKSGDSLATISYRYYGRTADYGRIFDANKEKLSSADQIMVGQKLRIPAL